MKTISGSENIIVRGTGLLVIEVINSNPNGDPDKESDPRQRPDERGEISPVSFKRKIRDLVEEKNGPVWTSVAAGFDPRLKPEDFQILESRETDRPEVEKEIKSNPESFVSKYWDARLFGNTFLEKNLQDSIRTGVAQFGLGVSLAPVLIARMTTTKKAPAEKDKTRGMAPLGYRIVQHGVYCMPFFINPTAAPKSGCTKRDIDVLLHIIPYTYTHTASYVRPFVNIRHAWYIEHKTALGSCSDFELIQALTPKKRSDPETPSTCWEEYDDPLDLGEHLKARIAGIVDLMREGYDGTSGT
ncbi:MAG: type I CRISPR-associated protein Cas7 [Thermodesulfobacteriota bacterium]